MWYLVSGREVVGRWSLLEAIKTVIEIVVAEVDFAAVVNAFVAVIIIFFITLSIIIIITH